MFKIALAFFKLDKCGFSLGSFRVGGANNLLEQGLGAGGWAAKCTLSHYLQEAEAAPTLLSLSADQPRTVLDCLALLESPGLRPDQVG